jgi:hypothetical protein
MKFSCKANPNQQNNSIFVCRVELLWRVGSDQSPSRSYSNPCFVNEFERGCSSWPHEAWTEALYCILRGARWL